MRRLRPALRARGPAVLAAAALVAAAPIGRGAVVDTPAFRVLGLVIVWGADAGGAAPVASDFVLLLNGGAAGTDLIAADVRPVVTGSLEPLPGANPPASLAPAATDAELPEAFERSGTGYLDAASPSAGIRDGDPGTDLEHRSSFYVASNTPFHIRADASLPAPGTGGFAGVGLGDVELSLGLRVQGRDGPIVFGTHAQDPGSVRRTNLAVPASLAEVAGTLVYTGTRATAATPGTLAEQSVRFDATYRLRHPTTARGAYDLSVAPGGVQYTVTYTVFVP